MRGSPNPWARVRGLEAAGRRAALRREAERVAAELGVDLAAVSAEVEAFLARCRAAGAVTPQEMAELVAAEFGLDPAELWAEAERLAAGRSA